MRILILFGALAVATVMLAPPADAQFQGSEPNPLARVHLNEIYASHSGTDDREFIELIGDRGGRSLDFHLVLIVEGDSTSAGTLDRAYVLTGHTIPSDRLFVLGNTAVPNLDLDIGADNAIENGTETIYLVKAADQAGVDAITALVGSDVDPDGDGTTMILDLATVLDAVAIVDGGYPDTDVVYDGAPIVGPDGTFFPAGIFRGGDFNAKWQKQYFLDFDVTANFFMPRTPGTPNTLVQDDIGFGGPGDARLVIFGQELFTGNSATVMVHQAPANTPLAILIADSMDFTAFAGGRLLPFPPDIFIGVSTDTNGQFVATIPGGFGKSFFFQGVAVDSNQPQGFAITNTVRVDFED